MLNRIKRLTHLVARQFVLAVVAFCLSGSVSNAEQIDSVPLYLPTHSKQHPEMLQQFQQALLSAGFHYIEIKNSDYWQEYQQSVRNGRLGIYYAPPHFTAWLTHKHNFTPLLKVNNALKYVIASKSSDTHIFEMSDLIGRKVCSQHPLNLDYLLINQAFQKSIRSAESHHVYSVFNEMLKSQSPCSAFSISNHRYLEQALETPSKYTRLAQSEQWNNYAVSIHPSFNIDFIERFTHFLQNEETQNILLPLLKLSSDKPKLTPSMLDDYPLEYLEILEPYWGK